MAVRLELVRFLYLSYIFFHLELAAWWGVLYFSYLFFHVVSISIISIWIYHHIYLFNVSMFLKHVDCTEAELELAAWWGLRRLGALEAGGRTHLRAQKKMSEKNLFFGLARQRSCFICPPACLYEDDENGLIHMFPYWLMLVSQSFWIESMATLFHSRPMSLYNVKCKKIYTKIIF